MTKKAKIYITLIVFTMLSLVAYEYLKPKEINWFPSYAKHHKIPFGTYVLHDQIEALFPKIKDVTIPPFEFLKNDTITGAYFFVNNSLEFDKSETEKLLSWTSQGNTLFIASENFSSTLLDTLNLETSFISNLDNINNVYGLQLKNKHLNQEIVSFEKADYITYFKKIDTLKTKVIGVVDNFDSYSAIKNEHVNIIKQNFGDGTIILCAFPQAFTNYFMLEDNTVQFTSSLLSYLNIKETIYIDNHYKSGKAFYTSPLHIMLNTKQLKWAYYIMLIGVLFYILFDGKRKQRAIPVITPLKNQTINFTQTVANMYLNKGNHKDIFNHKVKHFLDYIRQHYNLDTNEINALFLNHLASRSNNTIEDTKALFNNIIALQNKTHINQKELEDINTLIDSYKHNNAWKTKT
ncbi:DUF4350 domain-containing protein [Mangrovimonas spongiae]|uniref:DUF4350 domain-containing protein n=1 Tax=Mangrovimonas spongiae TaxID=2494697 RepID=A0A428JYC4_9FLAO|nr:DUF4350 domain-containing protein [Mangrovimonas spongiae]RSK39132.1 DUF4350 domain-containing protein [Mangrovimonas spongiae]